MDIPHRGPRLPEIFVQDSNISARYRASSRSAPRNIAPSSGPMPIPNATEQPPPPLPPPRHLADIADGGVNGPDLAWQWGNSHESAEWKRSMSRSPSGPGLHETYPPHSEKSDPRPDYLRRGSSSSTITSSAGFDERDSGHTGYASRLKDHTFPRDEGYASLSGTSIASNRSRYEDALGGRSGFQSSVHDKYRTNATAYDQSLVQKLNSRRDIDNRSPPRGFGRFAFSASANDASPTSRIASEHRHPTLKPLSLPTTIPKRSCLAESPLSHWADTPSSSAISPGNPYPRFAHTHYDHRSPSEAGDPERSPIPFARKSGSGSVASFGDDASSVTSKSRDSCDQRVSPDHDVDFHMEESGMRRLQIDDCTARADVYCTSTAAGQKRRASSPPRDDGNALHTVGSTTDLYRRRESASRASPSPRFHCMTGSISSSVSGPRSNSYASTTSHGASSIMSSSSYGRHSPGCLSPSTPDTAIDSPYGNPLSLNSSPRGSIAQVNHHRANSDVRPIITSRKLSDGVVQTKQSLIPRVQGLFICECCPKKPKKFDSQEDLNIHEQEKQYECAYCRNRFKNKNEAERHQNSLHLRRHSWSCAALSGYAAAFHNSLNQPNSADTCGYCGEDFPRSGFSSPNAAGQQVTAANEQDWDVRISHLQEMHKFGECNHAKKFFRADHFRQHLKHSHAGTSGKWTNMLENACMKEEPLPEPIRGPERISPGGLGLRVGIINEEEEVI